MCGACVCVLYVCRVYGEWCVCAVYGWSGGASVMCVLCVCSLYGVCWV